MKFINAEYEIITGDFFIPQSVFYTFIYHPNIALIDMRIGVNSWN